ncbi:hypothetical protein [Tropicimonas sp.]|uniref:hypothetical protein n=1 Tax=Tropicimonas sp. TaxID=2067044 RepID=UPI003A8B32F5
MRILLALVAASALAGTAAVAQQETADSFIGVFTTPALPLANCEVTGARSIASTAYGAGRLGGDFGLDLLQAMSDTTIRYDAMLRDIAVELGFNAVIDARIDVSHTADAVFESGQNWNSDGKAFDHSGTFIVVAYGTALNATCGD